MSMITDKILNGTRYFFKQDDVPQAPRRAKKPLDDIPANLRNANSKQKTTNVASSKSGDDTVDIISDNQTVRSAQADNEVCNESVLRRFTLEALDTNMVPSAISENFAPVLPEDSQRLVFQNYKCLSLLTLERLSQLLNTLAARKKPARIPRTLEVTLCGGYNELSAGALLLPREWQTLNAKHAWETEVRKYDSPDDSKSIIDSSTFSGELDRSPSAIKGERTLSEGRLSQPQIIVGSIKNKGKSSRSKSRAGLGNIQEDEEQSKVKPQPRLSMQKERSDSLTGRQLSVPKRTRHERRKTSGRLTDRKRRADDISNQDGISDDNSNRSAKGYSVSVLQFAMSSRLCEEKGWLVHDDASILAELRTVLEWACQRLQTSIKQAHEQHAIDKSYGFSSKADLVFYGEERKREPSQPSTDKIVQELLVRRFLPVVREMSGDPTTGAQSHVMTSAVSDGTICVLYESGNVAVMCSHSGPSRNGCYLNVFDDNPSKTLLASFTPTGRGTCNHPNGQVRFVSTDEEVLLMTAFGVCEKQLRWPTTLNAKLSATIQIQLNAHLVFRCVSRNSMSITFLYQRKSLKFPIIHTNVSSGIAAEDQARFLSGTMFSSQSARDINRQSRRLTLVGRKEKKSKKKGGNTDTKQSDDDAKLDDDESDAETESDLLKLSRRIKTLVADWMLYYRTTVGVGLSESEPASASKRSKSATVAPTGDTNVELSRLRPLTTNQKRPIGVTSVFPNPELKPLPSGLRLLTVQSLTVGERIAVPPPLPWVCKSPRAIVDHVCRSSAICSEDRRSGPCPLTVCRRLLGDEDVACRCSKNRLPELTDVEYDVIIQHLVPRQQMIIVCVVSSIYPEADSGRESMLEQVYGELNRNRAGPCVYSQWDPYRVFRYDVATAADRSFHAEPLLVWRHNVVPGMIMMYQNGKLLFCDHIFNGYGPAKHDFIKQLLNTRRQAKIIGASLPDDFRFSPQMGRSGARSAWGGEIGGADLTGRFGAVRSSSLLSSVRSLSTSTMSIDTLISRPCINTT